jgi:glycosyltransferase involved in cell wall biosynthesis
MRVVINQMSTAGVRTGIGHYTAQLLRCLRQHQGTSGHGETPQPSPVRVEGAPHQWVLQAMSVWGQVRPYLQPKGRPTASPLAPARTLSFKVLRKVASHLFRSHLHNVYFRARYDLYHEPNFIPVPSDLPTLATIHDLSVIHHPEWHPLDRVEHFDKHFYQGLQSCVHFLAISESARQEIIQVLNIPPEKVTRTYMGVRPGLTPLPQSDVRRALQKLNLPDRFFLYLGTIEPRKNVLTLLKAYCSLPGPFRARYPLLLVGGWGWNSGEVAQYLDDVGKARGVIYLGYVPEEYIAALYNGARALVFPSHYEGFGMPPIEMMACGGAVIASTAEALVETMGGKAHLVPPEDLDGWRQALLRAGNDDDWWQSLRENVTDIARPYTWEQCATDTLQVYRQLCQPQQPQAA